MSKQTYMMFDITIFSIICCVIEGVITYMSNLNLYIAEGFTVSFVVLFSLIGIFRWNFWGVIPGVAASIVAIIVQNSITTDLVAGYSNGMIVGSIGAILCVTLMTFFFKFYEKKKIKEKFYLLAMYVCIGYLLYIIVYSILWAIFDSYNIIDSFKRCIGRNILNVIMAVIVMFIANKQKNFLVDMNEYLIYVNTVPESARLRKELNEDEKNHSLTDEISSSKEINDIALLDGGTMSEEELILLNKTFKEKEGDKNHGTTKKS